jgi:uncharacterized protein (TIGR02145 family)
LAFAFTAKAQVRIGGTTAPNASAVLDLNTTDATNNGTKGLALPRVNGKSNVSSPVKGVLVYDTSDNKVYFYTGSAWVLVSDGQGVTSVSGALGLTVTSSTTTPTVSLPAGSSGQVLKYNGTAWAAGTDDVGSTVPSVTLGNRSWMTYNLGADPSLSPVQQVDEWASQNVAADATSPVTVMGDLYQWSRAADGHQLRTSTTSTTQATSLDAFGQPSATTAQFIIGNDDWRTGYADALAPALSWKWNSGGRANMTDPCPSGFRVPSGDEWVALVGQSGSSSTIYDNRWTVTYGAETYTWFKIADGVASTSWSAGSTTGGLALVAGDQPSYTKANTLFFLPAAGYRDSAGSFDYVGTYGYYWSSTPLSYYGYYLGFGSGYVNHAGNIANRLYGFSVRCVAEN